MNTSHMICYLPKRRECLYKWQASVRQYNYVDHKYISVHFGCTCTQFFVKVYLNHELGNWIIWKMFAGKISGGIRRKAIFFAAPPLTVSTFALSRSFSYFFLSPHPYSFHLSVLSSFTFSFTYKITVKSEIVLLLHFNVFCEVRSILNIASKHESVSLSLTEGERARRGNLQSWENMF